MKKRLHNKKAGITILVALIVIFLVDIIYRAVVMPMESFATKNFGEQLSLLVLAVIILVLSAKGKDRTCYICYGAWVGYFVLDQLLELPDIIINTANMLAMTNPGYGFGAVAFGLRILSMVAIIAIGGLLVEYMTDGTIYNRAFNALCFATNLMITVGLVASLCHAVIYSNNSAWLEIFNSLYRLAMVHLFTYFAYDSAKIQLEKTKLS